MAVGDTLGKGCWNTPRIVEYLVTWHTMKWLFRRLVLASGGPVCLFFFLQSETVVQTERRHFKVFTWRNYNEFLEPFWQPWPGVSPTAILNEEKALGTTLNNAMKRNRRNFSLHSYRVENGIKQLAHNTLAVLHRDVKHLESLAAPRATLTLLLCSPNFPRASYLDEARWRMNQLLIDSQQARVE